MSAIRNPATITSVGRRMMTAGGDITYTKAVLYGQDISHLTREQLESLTSIGNPLVTVPLGISDKNDNGNGTTVILEATFQNSNLKADLPYTAVGFFAKRGDDAEKLIAVGVATEGAYLAATSPDGIATDALDIKVAIAIGDSANVTAMIDPAGSVTPTELHNSITDVKTEMHTALDLKADKVDLELLAKTADVQAGLDTKANKTAVDSGVKSINDTLATKADKQAVTDDLATKADKTDVDAQIGTVTKSVSDLSDTVKANKDDTDKVLATKADKATVESELSTKANQSDLDKTNAEVAKKASTTDVNSQLATKADAKDVTDALALKDDTVDVDKKISNVTNSVNSLSSTVTSNKSATDTALGTKANANDVANSFEEVRNRVKKLEGQQELTAPDFNTLTSTGIYMIENPTNGKNGPSSGNWGTLVVSRGTTGSDSRILQEYYPDSGDLPYFRMSGPGGVWRDWKQLSDQSEINSLRDAVNTKADKTDVAKDIDTVNKSISSMSATITANQKATDTALDTKADKTTVNQELATKANSTDVDDKLAAKADSADVTKQIKTITDLASTKADQTALDATNATVATKANSTDVYTKTDTDKLLDAKADKTAVEQSLSTKANSADVDKKLDKKADKSSVDAKINAIDFSKIGFTKQYITNANGNTDHHTWFAKKQSDGTWTIDITDVGGFGDWTAAIARNNKRDIANLQSSKADTSTVNAQIADTKNAIKSNTDKLQSAINTKANASDVYTKKQVDDAFSSRDATIATKADKATVDAEISKIDFTPYAKTADVDSKLQGYTNTADLTKLLDVKANAVDVYSKTELDKKLLDLSTNTDGKVNADQVSSMIANKVDKSDLASDLKSINDSIATKANTTDVNTALAKKDDTTDVDAKIKTVIDLANTKADASDTYNKKAVDNALSNRDTNINNVLSKLNKINGTYLMGDIVDVNTLTGEKGSINVYLLRNSGNKNTPSWTPDNRGDLIVINYDGNAKTQLWFPVGAGNNKSVGIRYWEGATPTSWNRIAIQSDIYNLANQINQKANSSDVYSKSEANNLITDAKNTGKQAQATADSALAGYNKRPVISGGASDDLLSFKTTQLRYYPGNGSTCKNLPPATNHQWFTVEYIFENPNGDGIAIYRSPANEIWTIGNNAGYYDQAWVKVANANDIQGLQNQINTKLASGDLPTELQKITFRKQYVDGSNKLQDGHWKLVKQADGSYLVDLYHDDRTAQRVADLLNQIGSKADTATVNSQVADAKNAATKAQTTADNANDNANGRLSLNGGTMGSTAQISFADSGTWFTSNKPAGKRGGLRWDGQSDSAEIYADEDGSDNLDLVFQIGDDGSNHFSFRNQVGAEVAAIQSNGHYTGTIDWASVNGRPDVATHADVNNKVNVQGDLFRLANAGNTWVDILGVANSDTPVLVSIRDQGSGNLLGNYAAAIAFGGGDTKGVLNVAYSDHTARIIGGNGNAPVWHEDIAWKSDITNLQNQVNTKASASDVNSLNQTISALQQTVQSLQNTVNQQATQITGLQTQVNNQANEIKQLQETTIKGKTFSKSQEAAAEAWEKQNSQQIAFILDN